MNSSPEINTPDQTQTQTETDPSTLQSIRNKLMDKLKEFDSFEHKVMSDLTSIKNGLSAFAAEIHYLIDILNKNTNGLASNLAGDNNITFNNTPNNTFNDIEVSDTDSHSSDEEDEDDDNNDNEEDAYDEEIENQMIANGQRFFKAITLDNDNTPVYLGRFQGLTPSQAASKALTQIIKKSREKLEKEEKSKFIVGIKESTRGREPKVSYYQGTCVPLPEQQTIKMGPTDFVYKVKNHVQIIKNDSKEVCPEYEIIKKFEI